MFHKIKKNYYQAKRRLTWKLYRKNHILNQNIKSKIDSYLKKCPDIKLHLCCGDNKFSDYLNIDLVPTEGTDITMRLPDDLHLFPSDITSEVRIDSGFEHFYRYQLDDLLKEIYRILKPHGSLVLNWLPDFDLIIDAYTNKKKGNVSPIFDLTEVYRLTHGGPKPENSPQQLHKDLFTKTYVRQLLERNSFPIKQLSNQLFPGENTIVTMNIVALKA